MRETVRVEDGDKYAELSPGIGFSAELEISFENCPVIDRQFYSFDLDARSFKGELARARTFGFRHEVEYLQANGHALGGSLANSIVVDGDRIMNVEGLRYADEFVRHKLLDVVGDMALAGAPLFAQFRGYKTGHDTEQSFAARPVRAQRRVGDGHAAQPASATGDRSSAVPRRVGGGGIEARSIRSSSAAAEGCGAFFARGRSSRKALHKHAWVAKVPVDAAVVWM